MTIFVLYKCLFIIIMSLIFFKLSLHSLLSSPFQIVTSIKNYYFKDSYFKALIITFVCLFFFTFLCFRHLATQRQWWTITAQDLGNLFRSTTGKMEQYMGMYHDDLWLVRLTFGWGASSESRHFKLCICFSFLMLKT